MKSTTLLAILALVVFTSPLATYATPVLLPTQGCPTYLTSLTVDLVDSSPTQAKVGDLVTTKVHVVYPDGTPVQLVPQMISFLWTGIAGSKEFDNVEVAYAGSPGLYTYTQTLTSDISQATIGSASQGRITVSVVVCSCSDALGNRGPTGNIGSDETLTPSDNSNLNIGPQVTTQPISWIVPIIIAILLILALLLLLLRRRGKKK